MDLIEAERLEGTPANWTLGVFYRCKSDPRWIVPMPWTNAGWTPNLAHPQAVFLALVILAAAITPLAVAIATSRMREPKIAFATLLCLFVFILPPGVLARYRSS